MNTDTARLLVFQAVAAPLAMLSMGVFSLIAAACYLELVERLQLRLRPPHPTTRYHQLEGRYE